MKTGREKEAANNLGNCLDLLEKFFVRHSHTGSCAAIALIYIKAGHLEQAEQLLDRGLAAMAEDGVLHEAEFCFIRGELYLAKARHSSSEELDLAESALRISLSLASQRLQVLVAQQAVSLLVPLLRSKGLPEEAAEVEIEMQRLREDAAARAEKILAETGALLPANPEKLASVVI